MSSTTQLAPDLPPKIAPKEKLPSCNGESSRLLAIFALVFSLFFSNYGICAETTVNIPTFWDSKKRIDAPDISSLNRQIRFLTENDYPPFHFIGPDGALTGFEVELVRAICAELKVGCTIQPRRWDTLKDSLLSGQGDAIIASLRISAEARKDLAFSSPYFRNPARFVTKRSSTLTATTPDVLAGKAVAVVEKSAHEAFLNAFFPEARLLPQPNAAVALDAVSGGVADTAFVDGVSAAGWLNGEASADCCRFIGSAYTDSRYFGEGAGIAVAPANRKLVQAFDWAMVRLGSNGTYANLYLKYFPISPY